ncbi:hypothetical protein D3C84_454390 [compost metagenome]
MSALRRRALCQCELINGSIKIQVLVALSHGTVLINDRVDLHWESEFADGQAVTNDPLTVGIVTLSVPRSSGATDDQILSSSYPLK